jgi:hypothetical protein
MKRLMAVASETQERINSDMVKVLTNVNQNFNQSAASLTALTSTVNIFASAMFDASKNATAYLTGTNESFTAIGNSMKALSADLTSLQSQASQTKYAEDISKDISKNLKEKLTAFKNELRKKATSDFMKKSPVKLYAEKRKAAAARFVKNQEMLKDNATKGLSHVNVANGLREKGLRLGAQKNALHGEMTTASQIGNEQLFNQAKAQYAKTENELKVAATQLAIIETETTATFEREQALKETIVYENALEVLFKGEDDIMSRTQAPANLGDIKLAPLNISLLNIGLNDEQQKETYRLYLDSAIDELGIAGSDASDIIYLSDESPTNDITGENMVYANIDWSVVSNYIMANYDAIQNNYADHPFIRGIERFMALKLLVTDLPKRDAMLEENQQELSDALLAVETLREREKDNLGNEVPIPEEQRESLKYTEPVFKYDNDYLEFLTTPIDSDEKTSKYQMKRNVYSETIGPINTLRQKYTAENNTVMLHNLMVKEALIFDGLYGQYLTKQGFIPDDMDVSKYDQIYEIGLASTVPPPFDVREGADYSDPDIVASTFFPDTINETSDGVLTARSKRNPNTILAAVALKLDTSISRGSRKPIMDCLNEMVGEVAKLEEKGVAVPVTYKDYLNTVRNDLLSGGSTSDHLSPVLQTTFDVIKNRITTQMTPEQAAHISDNQVRDAVLRHYTPLNQFYTEHPDFGGQYLTEKHANDIVNSNLSAIADFGKRKSRAQTGVLVKKAQTKEFRNHNLGRNNPLAFDNQMVQTVY